MRARIAGAAAVLAAFAFGATGAAATHDSRVTADLVLYDGSVVTMDRDRPSAEGVAVRDGRIVAVGSSADVLRLAGRSTQRIDLRHRALLPGFVDSHDHVFNEAASHGMTLEQAQQLALANGITALGDMFVPPDLLQQMRAFAHSGHLRIRTSLYLLYNTNCGDVLGDWYLAQGPVTDPLRMLRIPGVKIFSDGGSCGRPAISWVYPPGAPGAGTQGDLWVTRAQLTAEIVTAQSHGWQVAVHALGDRALDVVLDSFSDALAGRRNVLRHRIEHNTLVRDDQLPRYRATGAVLTIFGDFGTCAFNTGGFGRADLIPAAEPWLWRWRDLLAVSPHVAWSSDWPVFTLDPFEHLYGFVTRRDVASDGTVCQPEPQQQNDTITIARALRLMTVDAAYALGQDSVIGSIEPGKLADLVVTTRNPLQVAADDLPRIRVLATLVGGKTEYCAGGAAAVCPP